jgi:hypothetical protein
MQIFLILIICCVMTSDFIVLTFDLPPLLHFIPEMLSCVLIVYVFIFGTRDRFQLVAPKYWLIFGALTAVVVCGVINSGTGSGAIITGMRFYFRALPMFFLPAVMRLTDAQLKTQLKWLLGLALLQLPVAGYQRWTIYSADRYSGDDVRGTLLDSGILSMFLISAALVLVGLLLKRRIGKLQFTILFFLMLLPTTINETKVTVIFLPLGLLVALLTGAEPGKRLRYAGLTLIALIGFGAIFIPVYDMLEEHNHYKVKLIDFFTNEQQLDKYLMAQGRNRGTGIGGKKLSGRGDAIFVPIAYLSRDPVDLAFGLGLGNVSPSNLGKNFEGSYYRLFRSVLITSFSYFVLELGFFGLILISFLYWMIFADTLVVARQDTGLMGAIAAGWTGITAIFFLAILYNVFYQFPSVAYLYWYFAGLICARRVALNFNKLPAAYKPTPTAGDKTLSA